MSLCCNVAPGSNPKGRSECKGKFRFAVEEYKAALALDPNHSAHNVNLHLGLCKVLVKLGKGKDAISSCSEALELDGELIDALVQGDESKLLTEDWKGAIADLNEAAEKSPQDRNIRKVLKRAERSLKLNQRKVCTRYWECQRHHLYQRS